MIMSPVTLIPAAETNRLKLHLADPALFFHAPEIDPLAGSHLGLSGFETILRELKQRRFAKSQTCHIELHIPAATLATDTEARLNAALADHVTALTTDEHHQLRLLAKERLRAWQVGGLFLAVCLILAVAIDQLRWSGSFIAHLMSETLVIAGWVGLWRPLELTLYEWWPSRFRLRILEQLATTHMTVTPV
nr:hypothetical protein [Polymorphobacter sp.]